MRKRIAIIAVFAALVLISGCMGQIEHLVKQGQTPDMTTCSDVVKDGQTTTQQLAGIFGSPTKVTTTKLDLYNRLHHPDGSVDDAQTLIETRTYQKGNLVVTVELTPVGVVVSHSCEIK